MTKFFMLLLLIICPNSIANAENGGQEYGKSVNSKEAKLAKSHFDIAMAYLKMGNNDKAIDELESAVGLNSRYLEAHYNLGVIYEKIHSYEDAINHFKSTIQLSPNHSLAHYHLGKSYYSYGRIEKSIIEYEKAVQLKPDEAIFYLDLAWAYYFKNTSNPKFIQMGDKAIKLDPNLEHTPLVKAFSYLTKKKYSQAIEEFEKAKELNPFDQIPSWGLVTTYAILERFDDFKEILVEIKKKWPESGFMYLRMAQIADEAKLGAKTIFLTKTAIKLFKDIDEFDHVSKSEQLLSGYIAKYPSNKNVDTENNNKLKDSQSDELTLIASYLNKTISLYSEFMKIIALNNELDAISLEHLNESITAEYLMKKGAVLAAKTEMAIDKFELNLKNLQPPDLKKQDFQKTTKDIASFLSSLPSLLEKQAKISTQKYNFSLSNDIDSFNSYDLEGRRLFITLLQFENNQINLYKLSTEKDSPKYQLYLCIQHVNNSLVYLIKARIKEFDDLDLAGESLSAQEVTGRYLQMAKYELETAEVNVNKGKEDLDQWVHKNKSTFSKNIKYSNFLERLNQSFKDSYKNEMDIINAFRIVLSEYPSDEHMDQFDLILGFLVDKRVSLQVDRNDLLIDLSK